GRRISLCVWWGSLPGGGVAQARRRGPAQRPGGAGPSPLWALPGGSGRARGSRQCHCLPRTAAPGDDGGMSAAVRPSTELGVFLRSRRARLAPEEAGLTRGDGVRRTPGLRREEVAALAGISIDYYIRLERGTERHRSPSVIDPLARALQLDADEHEHLRELAARVDRTDHAEIAAPTRHVRSGPRLLLEQLRPFPAYVTNRIGDLLAWIPAGIR